MPVLRNERIAASSRQAVIVHAPRSESFPTMPPRNPSDRRACNALANVNTENIGMYRNERRCRRVIEMIGTLHADFERYARDRLVPHDGELAAGVGDIDEIPRQLIDRERQRRERHRRANDVFVGRVLVGTP